ncbi:hypothetical protein IWZ00DRAFT_365399 [Phyllosticta capitalensis]
MELPRVANALAFLASSLMLCCCLVRNEGGEACALSDRSQHLAQADTNQSHAIVVSVRCHGTSGPQKHKPVVRQPTSYSSRMRSSSQQNGSPRLSSQSRPRASKPRHFSHPS